MCKFSSDALPQVPVNLKDSISKFTFKAIQHARINLKDSVRKFSSKAMAQALLDFQGSSRKFTSEAMAFAKRVHMTLTLATSTSEAWAERLLHRAAGRADCSPFLATSGQRDKRHA